MSCCKNVSPIDRVLRIVLGIVLIALVFIGPQTVWGWIGLVPLVTGALGMCPVYRLFGKSSCSM